MPIEPIASLLEWYQQTSVDQRRSLKEQFPGLAPHLEAAVDQCRENEQDTVTFVRDDSRQDTNKAVLEELVDAVRNSFEQAWRTGEPPSIAEYIENQPANVTPTLLAALIKIDCEYRTKEGQSPNADDYARLFPQYARRIEQVFAGERSWGEYEILEKLGQGGMGIVFKARQRSLNRIVALKMIKTGEFADAEDVQRFRAEAEAAAILDHPGIVPVYDVGERDGRHYFSMAYVQGASLSEKLREGPLQPKEAAALTMRIAEAVEYAHRHGVIHRDLKPGNVLIGKDGEPRVTDFGLAKRLSTDAELTHTGQILGTPSYMSPEQANCDPVDPQTDVYSLGAVLYALLTGHPPHQAASPIETIQQVLTREPVAPRELNGGIDVDLQTICLTCLAKETDSRYPSAEKLADELQRYLDGRPITARPIGTAGRAWRWMRRNPKMTGLLITAFTALLALIAGLSLAYHWTSAALTETTKAKQSETAALQQEQQARTQERDSFSKARRHFSLARSAVDRYLRKIADEPRLKSRGMEPLRKDLLADAAAFYEQLIQIEGVDPQLQIDRAASLRSLSVITSAISSRKEAILQLEEAIGMTQELVSKYPDSTAYKRELAEQQLEMARVYHADSILENAEDYCLQAIDAANQLLQMRSSKESRLLLARCYGVAGLIKTSQLNTTESQQAYDQAIEILEELSNEDGRDAEIELLLAESRLKVAKVHFLSREFETAERLLVQTRDVLAAAFPDRSLDTLDMQRVASDLGDACEQLAVLYHQQQEFEKAVDAGDQAKAIWTELLEIHPLNNGFRACCATTCLRLAYSHISRQEHEECQTVLQTLLDDLRYLDLKNRNYSTALAACTACVQMAAVRSLQSNPNEAIRWYTQAIMQLEELPPPPPSHSVIYYVTKIDARIARAQLYEKLKRHREAAADFRQAGEFNRQKKVRAQGFTTTCDFRYGLNLAATQEYKKATQHVEKILGDSDGPVSLFNLACVYAIASQSSANDEMLSLAERGETSRNYLQLAKQHLERASEAGAFDSQAGLTALQTERSLEPIRNTAEFKQILKRATDASANK